MLRLVQAEANRKTTFLESLYIFLHIPCCCFLHAPAHCTRLVPRRFQTRQPYRLASRRGALTPGASCSMVYGCVRFCQFHVISCYSCSFKAIQTPRSLDIPPIPVASCNSFKRVGLLGLSGKTRHSQGEVWRLALDGHNQTPVRMDKPCILWQTYPVPIVMSISIAFCFGQVLFEEYRRSGMPPNEALNRTGAKFKRVSLCFLVKGICLDEGVLL